MILKIYPDEEENFFENATDCIAYMKSRNFQCNVTLYAIKRKDLTPMIHEVYQCIKAHNKTVPLMYQILPTNPFYYNGIKGCLGVECVEIDMNTYCYNRDLLALFTGWDKSVLNK